MSTFQSTFPDQNYSERKLWQFFKMFIVEVPAVTRWRTIYGQCDLLQLPCKKNIEPFVSLEEKGFENLL